MSDFASWGYDEVKALVAKSPEWHASRRNSLGGSDANIIMSGDDEKLIKLWREKRGEAETENLDDVIPVVMGVITEPFNRYLYEVKTGRKVTHAGNKLVHPRFPWLHHNLDGLTTTTTGSPAIYEGKHVNPFTFDMGAQCQKYMGQMQHGMALSGHDYAVLSVLVGTLKYEYVEVRANIAFQAELLDREVAFWTCVKSGIPPAALPEIKAPVDPKTLRINVDMGRNNAWADAADRWKTTKPEHEKYEVAQKDLKDLIEKDVSHAFGHGVVIKRTSNNQLRITAEKQNGSAEDHA